MPILCIEVGRALGEKLVKQRFVGVDAAKNCPIPAALQRSSQHPLFRVIVCILQAFGESRINAVELSQTATFIAAVSLREMHMRVVKPRQQ